MASTSPRRERVSGRTGCRSTRILADLWRDTCVLLCAPKLEHRVPVGPSERETGIYIHSRRPVPVLTSARAFYRRALKQSPCTIDGRNGNDRVWIHAIVEFDRSPNRRTDRERVFSPPSIPLDVGSLERDRVFSLFPDVSRKPKTLFIPLSYVFVFPRLCTGTCTCIMYAKSDCLCLKRNEFV